MTRPTKRPEHICMACGVGIGPWETAVAPDHRKAEYLCRPCYITFTERKAA